MATKETEITTETEEDGTETVTEISTTISDTAADGTETVAEITTTQGDEPSEIEGHIVVILLFNTLLSNICLAVRLVSVLSFSY